MKVKTRGFGKDKKNIKKKKDSLGPVRKRELVRKFKVTNKQFKNDCCNIRRFKSIQ